MTANLKESRGIPRVELKLLVQFPLFEMDTSDAHSPKANKAVDQFSKIKSHR